jgi:hypothetical protein
MYSYERLEKLKNAGVPIEKYSFRVPQDAFEYSEKLITFEDGAIEYLEQIPRRVGIPTDKPDDFLRLPNRFLNIAKKAEDRNIYLNILEHENVDTRKLENKLIRCDGRFIWQPDSLYYFRLPKRFYVLGREFKKITLLDAIRQDKYHWYEQRIRCPSLIRP